MTQAIRPMPEEMPVELWRGFKPNNAVWQGSVVEIFIAPESAAEMVPLAGSARLCRPWSGRRSVFS